MTNNDQYMQKARELVCTHFNETNTDFVKDRITNLVPDDFYIVWFSKTLQNWKALVSTDKVNGLYYEATYNGDRLETYLDVYIKMSNVSIPDNLFENPIHIKKEI